MIYNASNHTIQFDDGRTAATFSEHVTAEQGFSFADSFEDGNYKALYRHYFDQATALEFDLADKTDLLRTAQRDVRALTKQLEAMKQELAEMKEVPA